MLAKLHRNKSVTKAMKLPVFLLIMKFRMGTSDEVSIFIMMGNNQTLMDIIFRETPQEQDTLNVIKDGYAADSAYPS